MNILFLTLLYPPEQLQAVQQRSRDGLQNQIHSFQMAMRKGLQAALQPGETLRCVNALPVGIFPKHYKRLWLSGRSAAPDMEQLGSLNLPWLKQRARARKARRALERWIAASPDNRTILVYTLYLPYMQAVQAVRKRHPDVRAAVIVTDLPNELGIASGRKGLLQKLEFRMGERRLALCRAFDGFVLLTAPMAQALGVETQPSMVLEGLIAEQSPSAQTAETPADMRPAVLYTGTLNRELGIGLLLEAFAQLPEAQLWLCGKGDLEPEAREAAARLDNIHYFGYVPQQTALALQAKATALINPRTAEGVFTRYSFPSKTLEYMRSGKPVLCCKLEGIPDEYDPYLRYIAPQTAEGIRGAVHALLALPDAERTAMGEKARAFVLENKSSRAQAARLLQWLRTVPRSHRDG